MRIHIDVGIDISVKLQTLSMKNDKLQKKIKIQQAKIEMYKKKLCRNKEKEKKANRQNKENVSSISSLSVCSSGSSSNSGNHRRSKKRKFGEMASSDAPQQVTGNGGDKRSKKRVRTN